MIIIKNNSYFSILKRKASYLLLILFLLVSAIAQAQNTDNEQVKRLQRAIYIFNFAQQVSWDNLENVEHFKIGVLGNDRTIIDLNALAAKRKIYNKPVETVSFSSVKDIKDVHVLYVNNRFNFDINYLLSKIENKNILLITEDYKYNASMINIVNVNDSFEYEINKNLIKNEGLQIAPSLETNAVSSAEKWKLLYNETSKNLKEVKTSQTKQQKQLERKAIEIKAKETIIKNQNTTLDTIKNQINNKDNWIKQLQKNNAFKDKKIEEKIAIEKHLEQLIELQLDSIKSQNLTIANSKKNIDAQNEFLSKLNNEIEAKQDVLRENQSQINKLKFFNYLLGALVILTAIAGFLIYSSYRQKKKLNNLLREKNKVIYSQTQKLTSQNKELEQFAYITSHDLKEPLNTISGLIGLLLEDYEDTLDEDGKMSLNFINESSLRMKELIDSLLEYSRLGKSKAYTKVDTSNTLKHVKTDLAGLINEAQANILVDDLPTVTGSELELRLLFQNLISNSIKFVAPGTTPKIEISSSKTIINEIPFWQFQVKDNGIGIPESHQDRIFAIFQRLHSRDDYEGTGIGLAHCKKIVESHGGTIWLKSKVSLGTTFFFTIPIDA